MTTTWQPSDDEVKAINREARVFSRTAFEDFGEASMACAESAFYHGFLAGRRYVDKPAVETTTTPSIAEVPTE